jgi:hypothetical protein
MKRGKYSVKMGLSYFVKGPNLENKAYYSLKISPPVKDLNMTRRIFY